MPDETPDNFITAPMEPGREPSAGRGAFEGFAPPTSNTTYTPNQFFDVCIPSASRGCVRIVAYLIRKTLGWCDADGNPREEVIEVGYAELIRRAGVSRDMIRQALDEAVAGHFVVRLREGRRSLAGSDGERSLFSLKWDAGPEYVRQPERFRGFFEGEGNRTDIPNEFFDRLIPAENLSVIKVVGSVIRHSIGFQARRGMRRQQAPLAYSRILSAGGLSSRRTLAAAIQESIAKGYIVRVEDGCFSARVSERRSAVYAVRWADNWHPSNPQILTGRKRIPAGMWINRSEKDTSGDRDQSEKDTSSGPERIPADRSEKDTIEIKQLNEKQKQRTEAAGLLRKAGFDDRTSEILAGRHGLESVARQIEWLPRRRASKNPLGLLRRAIENSWPAPEVAKAGFENPEPAPALPAGYADWLKEQLRTLARTAPEDYARFEAKRQRRRNDLNTEKLPLTREWLLARHDSEARRLMDFQTFLGLPGVREWAREFNNQSNQTQS